MKHTTNTIVAEKPTQHLWFWQRATPRRKPGEQTKTVVFQGYGHMSMPRKTSPARARKRLEAKIGYAEGVLRDHEVGTNPIYLGHPRGGSVHKAWLEAVEAWKAARRRQAVGDGGVM